MQKVGAWYGKKGAKKEGESITEVKKYGSRPGNLEIEKCLVKKPGNTDDWTNNR